MDDTPSAEPDAPTEPPTDAAEELERLRHDAEVQGVDLDAAIELARTLEHTLPTAAALRAVDRRIAQGMSLEEARATLLDELT
jgi:hypothetical protein